MTQTQSTIKANSVRGLSLFTLATGQKLRDSMPQLLHEARFSGSFIDSSGNYRTIQAFYDFLVLFVKSEKFAVITQLGSQNFSTTSGSQAFS
jgi:hypothetical protein